MRGDVYASAFYILLNQSCVFFLLTPGFFSLQRFEKDDMYRLLEALDIPENYISGQRTNAPGIGALMILLRRFAYPNRWCDLVSLFGGSTSELV